MESAKKERGRGALTGVLFLLLAGLRCNELPESATAQAVAIAPPSATAVTSVAVPAPVSAPPKGLPPECELYIQQYDCFLKHVSFSQNAGEELTPDQLTERLRATYTQRAMTLAGWASVQQSCVKTQASLASAIEQAGCTNPATAPPPKPQVAPAPASTTMQIGGECQFGDDCDWMDGPGFCDNDDSPGHCELVCKTDCDCPSDRHCGPYQHPDVSGGRKACLPGSGGQAKACVGRRRAASPHH